MKLRLRGKIAAIIIAGISVLCALLIIVSTVSFHEKVTAEFDGRIVSLGENLADTVSGPLSAAMSDGNEELSPEILQLFQPPLDYIIKQNDIAYAVLSYKSKQLVQSNRFAWNSFNPQNQQQTDTDLLDKYNVYEYDTQNEQLHEIRIAVKNVPGAEILFGYSNARISDTKNGFMIKSILIGLLGITLMSMLSIIFLNKTVIKPLSAVTAAAMGIAQGRLKQDKLTIKSNDEIGELAEVFNTMLSKLNLLVTKAERIAEGRIGASEIEADMLAGKKQQITSNNDSGDLETAFEKMQNELQKLTIQARRIANDDLYNSILEEHISGELGEAFTQMTTHFKQLATAAEKIAKGDLTVKIVSGNGNRGLTISFSKMVTNLQEIILNINNSASGFNGAVSSLTAVAGKSSENCAYLNTAMEQIARASNDVASSTQKASASSSTMQQLSGKGQQMLNNMLEKIDLMKKSMDYSLENIRKLSKRSQDISEIVSVITDISDQTNLLALNAAIEAARAGDAGRGFAVVASEVRKLAESSQQQTNRISQIIKDILGDTQRTQESAETSAKTVVEGTQLVSSISNLFGEINMQINNVAAQIEQIAANAQETSASTEEISSQYQEQSASAKNVHASVEQLKNSTVLLQKSTERFSI